MHGCKSMINKRQSVESCPYSFEDPAQDNSDIKDDLTDMQSYRFDPHIAGTNTYTQAPLIGRGGWTW